MSSPKFKISKSSENPNLALPWILKMLRINKRLEERLLNEAQTRASSMLVA